MNANRVINVILMAYVGMVGNRCELKEKIMLKMIGAKTKAKIIPT